ncbi:MAG: uridine kinase [Candidatus Hydrogenedentes bacterium]|nr:uridine kinase [Candidatus Hydrogenedentota bacterium]
MAPYLIGIAGPSCAGKTVLAHALAARLARRQPVILPLDMYYADLAGVDPAARSRANFDTPDALDWPLVMAHVTALARGRAIAMPVYDFVHHTRAADTRPLGPGRIVIVEGLFALAHPELRALYDTRVFVTAPDAVCLARREARDVRERGRSAESVRTQYAETVRPMAQRHVLPTQRFADFVVSGDEAFEAAVEQIAGRMRLGLGSADVAG